MSTPEAIVFLKGNDNYIQPDELKNELTGVYLTDSDTVVVTVVNAAGTAITGVGVTWPMTMSYVNGYDGRFYTELPKEMVVSIGDFLRAKITATTAGGKVGYWEYDMVVEQRETI